MAKEPPPDDEIGWGKYLSMGLETAIGAALGYVVGAWLDRRYHWTPWGATVGTMIGVAAGMYLLIKEALKMNRD
jgi:F0F1-type ATP synthase assembly protein I